MEQKETQKANEALGKLETAGKELEQIQTEAGYVLIDGVVIATSTAKETTEFDVEEKRDAQSSYYNLLKHRFVLLRTTLRCSPPANTITDLDESHPITLPFHVKAARAAWTQILYTAEPQMVQLACMDMESVLGVLRLLGDVMSKCIKDDDADQLRRIGAWAWGLLGRCRDVGELGSEEVGELRVFGRKALLDFPAMRPQQSKQRDRGGTLHLLLNQPWTTSSRQRLPRKSPAQSHYQM